VGRDVLRLVLRLVLRCFNPRARVGRDPSILCVTPYVKSFNPRARVGRDHIGLVGGIDRAVFQSTRPRGARLYDPETPDHQFAVVSIHAPAWGAT